MGKYDISIELLSVGIYGLMNANWTKQIHHEAHCTKQIHHEALTRSMVNLLCPVAIHHPINAN